MNIIDTTAWRTDSTKWNENRYKQWLDEGMLLVTSMYQRGGDLNPEKAEFIKRYFLTGQIADDAEFPLFYILRFYPGYDPIWLEKTIINASDSQLGRFIFMYNVDSLGNLNEMMADFWFGEKVTERLLKANKVDKFSPPGDFVFQRDFFMVKKNCMYIRRSMKRNTKLSEHYIYCLGEEWLIIAQNFSSRLNCRDRAFVKVLEQLADMVLWSLNSKKLGSAEHIVALKTKELLDTRLVDEYDLANIWLSKKVEAGVE
jgi:hypothetical protein